MGKAMRRWWWVAALTVATTAGGFVYEASAEAAPAQVNVVPARSGGDYDLLDVFTLSPEQFVNAMGQ